MPLSLQQFYLWLTSGMSCAHKASSAPHACAAYASSAIVVEMPFYGAVEQAQCGACRWPIRDGTGILSVVAPLQQLQQLSLQTECQASPPYPLSLMQVSFFDIWHLQFRWACNAVESACAPQCWCVPGNCTRVVDLPTTVAQAAAAGAAKLLGRWPVFDASCICTVLLLLLLWLEWVI
ncbi:hypothetical protein COO60DRAFT_231991 [Scenedesmus sp. NREL 46B-D3]|nr:hypothetical protein COO60DRAFT_231991 [Scenedesmus sp. NREL 46B-D3]